MRRTPEKVSIYSYSDYRNYLHARLENASSQWGSITKLAGAIGCQRSQLSRVLNSSHHLTMDQGYGVTQFWNMTEDETEYFLALLEWARSGSKAFQLRLERKINQLKSDHENLAKRIQHPRLEESEKERVYYSAWYWGAIHIAVSIPALQTPEAVSRYLSLPPSIVRHCLESLVAMKLVRRVGNRYLFDSSSIHLPRESPLNTGNFQSWKTQAILNAQRPGSDGLHYVVSQSVSRRDIDRQREIFLRAIQEFMEVGTPSEPEELVCLSLDYFQVGEH